MKQIRKNSSGSAIIAEPEKCFVDDTALKIGKSIRSINNYVQIVTNISEEIRELIKGTPLEDRLTDLLRLSHIKDEARQRELVEKSSTVKQQR